MRDSNLRSFRDGRPQCVNDEFGVLLVQTTRCSPAGLRTSSDIRRVVGPLSARALAHDLRRQPTPLGHGSTSTLTQRATASRRTGPQRALRLARLWLRTLTVADRAAYLADQSVLADALSARGLPASVARRGSRGPYDAVADWGRS